MDDPKDDNPVNKRQLWRLDFDSVPFILRLPDGKEVPAWLEDMSGGGLRFRVRNVELVSKAIYVAILDFPIFSTSPAELPVFVRNESIVTEGSEGERRYGTEFVHDKTLSRYEVITPVREGYIVRFINQELVKRKKLSGSGKP